MTMSEREKFEIWATGRGLLMTRELKRTSWTKAIKTDRYANEYSQGAWDGWQASRRAALMVNLVVGNDVDPGLIQLLRDVCHYADSVCGMLRAGGWPGKAEALESRIKAVIDYENAASQGIKGDERPARIREALGLLKQDYSPECLQMASVKEYVQDAAAQLIDAGYFRRSLHCDVEIERDEDESGNVNAP